MMAVVVVALFFARYRLSSMCISHSAVCVCMCVAAHPR